MKQEILDLLSANDYESAASHISALEKGEIVSLFGELKQEQVIPLCRSMERDFLAEILVELSPELQKKIIEGLNEEELQEVMDEVSAQDTAEIIEDLPENTALKIAEKEEITILLSEKKFATLKPLLASMNEIDLARIFEEVDESELPMLFRLLPKDLAAQVFVEMDSEVKKTLLNKLNDIELKAVMDELFIDDTVDLIEEMPSNVVKRLLAQSDQETRNYVNDILKYPKDSAGSIMTVEYVALAPTMTVKEAFAKIRTLAIDKETIYTCYVIDKTTNKLIGAVTAKELLLADENAKISDIMEENVIFAYTLDDKETVARKLADYGFIAIPIVDEEKRLVGIVTVDDAIDVLQAENSEDIAKMAAITPSSKPYLKTSVFAVWKNRIPWLLILMISATFTGLIINTYEGNLNAISTVLFACVPMIMDTGGNAGSQASVTVIRSLALGELSTKDVLSVLWKELRVSILLGLSLAVVCFIKLTVLDNMIFGYTGYTVMTCLIVSIALAVTVVVAKLVGCSLPLLAKKCKLDPAVVASPFITTIVDAVSLFLYCNLAVALL